ncbi:hypothetical protein LZ30DRAFT_291538 [Colletotrichum cereale]|nr:hypothetical protein LZ30DRAFT_291538 [Colletotrichum cereale]
MCDCRLSRSSLVRVERSSSSRISPMSQSSLVTSSSNTSILSAPSVSPSNLEPLQAPVTAAFFAFVGESASPVTDIFSVSFMQTYLKTSIPVRAVVKTIGNICLEIQGCTDLGSKKSAAAAVMAKDRSKLNEFLEQLIAPDSHDQHVMLLYGMLKIYADLMSSENCAYFHDTCSRLAAKVREQLEQRQQNPVLYFDKGLLMNFSLFLSFWSLLSFKDHPFSGIEAYDPLPYEDIDSLTGEIRINSAVFHHYVKFMENFAHLHYRVFKWVPKARSALKDRHLTGEASTEDLKEILVTSGLMQKGKKIVESSAPGVHAMENLCSRGYGDDDNDNESEKPDFYILREAFYRYCVMGLTRIFADPVWQLVDENLPHVGDVLDIEALSEFIRERFAQRLQVVGMEALSHLIVFISVGIESRMPKNRERVIELFDEVKRKGFVGANTFFADVELFWKTNLTIPTDAIRRRKG